MSSLTIQITDTNDDTRWDNSAGGFGFAVADTEPAIGTAFGSNENSTSYRFPNVTIAQGTTITSAVVSFKAATSLSTTTCSLRIYGNAADNASAPTTSALAKALVKTTAFVADSNVQTWVQDTLYTYDVTTIVQEILNRGGFSSGNAIQLMVLGQAASSAERQIWDVASDAGNAASITITYGVSTENPAFLLTMI